VQLIFGNPEHIKTTKEVEKRFLDREKRFKESGLSRVRFEIKEELEYWGVYTI